MAYRTYTTEAVVCGHRPHMTSDMSFLLYTEDAGMVWATARSVREEKSKQRSALQDFSVVRVSLVKGKTGWRIGSVSCLENPFLAAETQQQRAFISRVVKLVRRLVQGEEVSAALWRDLREVLQHLPQVAPDDIALLGDTFTLRALHHLGYIPSDPSYESVLHDAVWYSTLRELPPQADTASTRGLQASHL